MSATEMCCPYSDCGTPIKSFEVVCPTCKRDLAYCPTCGGLLASGASLCSLCNQHVVVWTTHAEEPLALLADSYRLAALNNVDMRALAGVLDAIRAVMLGENNRFRVWDTIKGQIGQFRGEGVNQVLNELRFRYLQYMLKTSVAEINAALDQSSERGWNAWLSQLTEALSEWSISFFAALAAWPFSFDRANLTDHEHVQRCARFVEMEQWPEALPLFEFLYERSELPPPLIGHCLRVAAEVQLYHLEAPDESVKLIRRLQALTPNDKAVPLIWNEFHLYKKDYLRARECAHRTMEIDKTSPEGYNAMGDVLKDMGKPLDEVEGLYRLALRAAPGDTTAYTNLIRLYGRPDDFATHKDVIEQLVKQGSTVEPSDRYSLCLEAAEAFRQNNQDEQAHNWFQQAIRLDPTKPRGLINESFAYIEEEEWDRAREKLKAANQVAPEVFAPYWYLGWIDEISENWAGARSWYESSLPYRTQWRSRIQSKIAEMRWKSGEPEQAEKALYATLQDAKRQDDPGIQFVIDTLHSLADEYKAREDWDAAQRVYANILATIGNSYQADYCYRVANLDYERGDYELASTGYRQAIEADPGVAVYHTNLALASRELKMWDLAREERQKAYDLDKSEASFRSDMALIENAEANALYSVGNYAEAADKYRKAIEFNPKDAVLHSNLADALENRKTPGRRAIELAEAIAAMQQALAYTSQSRKKDYDNWIRRLQDSLALIERYSESTPDLLPIVTPIMLEIESALIPADTSTQRWVLFTDYIPHMRTDIQKRVGIEVTGVRVRRNDSLGVGGYSILLDEVPIISGTTQTGWGFAHAPQGKLVENGIPDSTLVSTADLLSGDLACWVMPEQWDAVKALGVDIRPDPLAVVIDLLEAVLLHHISDFATFQTISTLIDSWSSDPQAASLIPSILPDEEARLRIWQVLKALLVQHVPITTFVDILTTIQETGLADLELAVREVRLHLKPYLPGNTPGARCIVLPLEQETALLACLENGDIAGLVQAEFAVLSEIRSMAQPDERNTTLVVSQAELASHMRQILWAELPYLAVLTQEELLAPKEIEPNHETSAVNANGA